MTRRRPTPRRLRKRDEAGYAAILVALLASTVFLGVSAFGVDLARMYVEVERIQKAADAAALAGVTFLPTDMNGARTKAIEVAGRNGFPNAGATTVTVSEGSRPSQLRVTISSTVDHSFAQAIGLTSATIVRSAVADYTAPAPMGSPCNTFGNEPPSQSTAAQPSGSAPPSTPLPFANCQTYPKFWAAIEGPGVDKIQGDRYMTIPCSTVSAYTHSSAIGCADSKNSETHPEGYFYAVHVEPAAVNQPIDVQIYDPAYIFTTVNCQALGDSGSYSNTLADTAANAMNDYVPTDAAARYDDATSVYCSGDYVPGGGSGSAPDTSFVLREQTDTGDPMKGAVISGCTKQFRGLTSTPTPTNLKKFTTGTTKNANYNPELARVFHQWVSLCTFTPTRKGDYYLQVRTNVPLGGAGVPNTNASGTTFNSMVYTGNAAASAATGSVTNTLGLNSYSLRAVPTSTSLRDDVAVSGYSRMPILQNTAASTATFNLIKALPNARGQYVAFDFFDAADGSSSNGSVRVIAPTDATGSIKASANIPGCKGAKNSAAYTNLSNCTVTVNRSTHGGQLQHMVIPLPSDYNCDPSTLGGCWFKVEITFSGAITDFTTWDANIGGDPVRLIE